MKKFMLRATICMVTALICSNLQNVYGLRVGSPTIVSVEVFTQLPQADNDNKIEAGASMRNGFELENASTTCTFDSMFPTRGTVDLNGGTLILTSDLELINPVTFDPTGTIQGNGHVINFAQCMCDFSPNTTAQLEDIHLDIHSDMKFAGTTIFSGDSSAIFANNNKITIEPGAQIVLDSGVTLTIKDAEITSINTTNIRCVDDTARLVLENVKWIQNGDYSFDKGSIVFKRTNTISGGCKFSYCSSQTSFILKDSELILSSAVTFSYDPVSTVTSLLQFDHKSAALTMRDRSVLHAQSRGIALTKGTLNVNGHCCFSGDVTHSLSATSTTNSIYRTSVRNRGVCLGYTNPADDLLINIYADSVLHVRSGTLMYRNSTPLLSPHMPQPFVLVDKDARLYVRESLDCGEGVIIFEDGAILHKSTGKTLSGSVLARGQIKDYLAI